MREECRRRKGVASLYNHVTSGTYFTPLFTTRWRLGHLYSHYIIMLPGHSVCSESAIFSLKKGGGVTTPHDTSHRCWSFCHQKVRALLKSRAHPLFKITSIFLQTFHTYIFQSQLFTRNASNTQKAFFIRLVWSHTDDPQMSVKGHTGWDPKYTGVKKTELYKGGN